VLIKRVKLSLYLNDFLRVFLLILYSEILAFRTICENSVDCMHTLQMRALLAGWPCSATPSHHAPPSHHHIQECMWGCESLARISNP